MKSAGRQLALAGGAVTALFGCLLLALYSAPARVEDMDRLLYCACGYSTVQFKEGKITMVQYLHDTVKPGDVVGRYYLTNRLVELEIYWKGETNVVHCKVDNIGMLAESEVLLEYYAFDSKSLKPRIYHRMSMLLSRLIECRTRR